MISVTLMGRMGNNLFQIASGLCLAKKHNTVLHIPIPSWNNTAYSYLNCFKMMDVHFGNPASMVYKEQHFFYNELFDILPDNVHLYGYFQSEKYFKSYESLIRSNFEFNDTVVQSTKAKLDTYDIDYKEATAIHLRRTDYLTIQHAHPIPSLDYYKDGLKLMNAKNVIVSSDDIEWCRANIKIEGINFIFSDMPQEETICAMTMVKNLVIANSTFSWWGAWLNKHPEKQVVYPKQWFGNTLPYRELDINHEVCTKDIPCAGWIGL